MKRLRHIMVAASIMLSGLSPALGSSLLKHKTPTVNRWPYSFGAHYIYDNGGSRWNYGRGYRYHRDCEHGKHQRLRFIHGHKRPTNEKLEGLIKHLTRHSSP